MASQVQKALAIYTIFLDNAFELPAPTSYTKVKLLRGNVDNTIGGSQTLKKNQTNKLEGIQ